jgi:hypothetical protein
VQNDEIRIGGSGGLSAVVGKITNLRGTWIRIVTRIKFAGGTGGAFEVWLNGTKRLSLTNRAVLPHDGNTKELNPPLSCPRAMSPCAPSRAACTASSRLVTSASTR